jgi:hypothetical protein
MTLEEIFSASSDPGIADILKLIDLYLVFQSPRSSLAFTAQTYIQKHLSDFLKSLFRPLQKQFH